MNIGPFEIETKLSATGALAILMAFTALVGGWYKFNYRVTILENDRQDEIQFRQNETVFNEKLNDTLNNLNITVGKLEQQVADEQTNRKKREN